MVLIAVFVLALLTGGCASTGPASVPDAAENEVLTATDAWRAAYDSRDPARITSMYGKGAVFWGTTMKSIAASPNTIESIAASPESIAEYFKDEAGRPNARVVFTDQHVRVFGHVAFNSGAYTFRDNRDGEEITSPSRFSMVFQRQGGAWVLVHHHSSRVP